jgi:hypothetical protein
VEEEFSSSILRGGGNVVRKDLARCGWSIECVRSIQSFEGMEGFGEMRQKEKTTDHDDFFY